MHDIVYEETFGLSFTYLKPLQCKTVKTHVLPNTGSPHYNPEEKTLFQTLFLMIGMFDLVRYSESSLPIYLGLRAKLLSITVLSNLTLRFCNSTVINNLTQILKLPLELACQTHVTALELQRAIILSLSNLFFLDI